MTVRSAPQPTVFVNYARQDIDLVEEFKNQLSSLEVPLWYDQDIMLGINWEDALHQSLHEAAIILLLVSPDFIASDSCLNIEAKRALERPQVGRVQVIPVLLHSVDWPATPFADLEYLPHRRKPVEAWLDRDEAFRGVTRDLRREVQKCQLEAAIIPNVKELQQIQEERRKQL